MTAKDDLDLDIAAETTAQLTLNLLALAKEATSNGAVMEAALWHALIAVNGERCFRLLHEPEEARLEFQRTAAQAAGKVVERVRWLEKLEQERSGG
jgi:nitrate reductase alpha subunit